MNNNQLERVNELHATKLKEYQEYKELESANNAKASVHLKQAMEILELIPANIAERLRLIPAQDLEKMSFEELVEYEANASTQLSYIMDKIEKYLETDDISHLSGIEDIVLDIPTEQPMTQTSLTEQPMITQVEIEFETGDA